MVKLLVNVGLFLIPVNVALSQQLGISELLGKYAANQDKLRSWSLKCETSVQSLSDPNMVKVESHDIRFDGTRVRTRICWWGNLGGLEIPQDNPTYLSVIWDGETIIKYVKRIKDNSGVLSFDRFVGTEKFKDSVIRTEQYKHAASTLMGRYGRPFERIDQIIREANTASVRAELEPVNGMDCFAIDAQTRYGDYAVWIDPEHGYNVAKVRVDGRKNGVVRDRSTSRDVSLVIDNIRFEEIAGVWAAMEADFLRVVERVDHPEAREDLPRGYRIHIKITELVLDPDHDTIGSFLPDDVDEGAEVWISPVHHIRYTWRNAKMLADINEDALKKTNEVIGRFLADGGTVPAIANSQGRPAPKPALAVPNDATEADGNPQMLSKSIFESTLQMARRSASANLSQAAILPNAQGDEMPESMTIGQEQRGVDSPSTDANNSTARDDEKTKSAEPKPQRPRTRIQCGLFCLYSLLKLGGCDVDFRDLIKPEYLSTGNGSTLAELKKAAMDYGLYPGIGARLTTSFLRQCPYPLILHVKSDAESKKYDHYELFLGTDNGQAKMFNPPEPIKLMPFSEVAPRWDGYGLIVSSRPFDCEALLAGQSHRILVYAAIGAIAVVMVHIIRQRYLAVLDRLSSWRWSVGMSLGQCAALGVIGLLFSMLYHLADEEQGLLANVNATASLQKAYLSTFIPRISERKTRKLLGTDTVLIDARYARDYEAGHLEGAISLPVDANDAEYRSLTAKIKKSSAITVYCKSSKCKFAESVSLRLLQDGFFDVSIFKGGWAEWVAKNGEPPKKTKILSKQNDAERDQTY